MARNANVAGIIPSTWARTRFIPRFVNAAARFSRNSADDFRMTTSATRGFHFLIALLVVVLDRAAKWLVARDISLHESIPVIPGFFRITHVENRGAAFGLFADRSE